MFTAKEKREFMELKKAMVSHGYQRHLQRLTFRTKKEAERMLALLNKRHKGKIPPFYMYGVEHDAMARPMGSGNWQVNVGRDTNTRNPP